MNVFPVFLWLFKINRTFVIPCQFTFKPETTQLETTIHKEFALQKVIFFFTWPNISNIWQVEIKILFFIFWMVKLLDTKSIESIEIFRTVTGLN